MYDTSIVYGVSRQAPSKKAALHSSFLPTEDMYRYTSSSRYIIPQLKQKDERERSISIPFPHIHQLQYQSTIPPPPRFQAFRVNTPTTCSKSWRTGKLPLDRLKTSASEVLV